jgi:hypothetical protein
VNISHTEFADIRVIKSRMMISAKHVVGMGEMRNAYKILDRKPERKKQLARPRQRYEGNIQLGFKHQCEGMDWIHLAQPAKEIHKSIKNSSLVITIKQKAKVLQYNNTTNKKLIFFKGILRHQI